MKKPIWYLAGPFYRYEGDVKALAAKAGVRIVDANVTDSREGAAPDDQLPAVTLKPEFGGQEATADKPATAADLRATLEAAGVPVPAGLKKADLQAMVDSLPKP